jgi:AraC-like DNA-binding protein
MTIHEISGRGQHDVVRYARFPVPGVEAMEATTARSYPRHTHDQFGIGLVTNGRHASWSGVGHVEAGPGDFICVNPGEVHDGHGVAGGQRSWRILYFEPGVVADIRGDLDERPAADYEFEAPVFSQPELRDYFNGAYALVATTGEGDAQLEGETRLFELFARLTPKPFGHTARRPACRPQIRRMKRLIDESPALPWSLSELSRAAGFSRYQFLRGFAHELGLTPHSYIVQRRLELAKQLMRGGRGLAEVALTAGFSDQSHLTRTFARQFGVTPHQYRLAIA